MTDHYETLGIDKDVPQDAIKSAYKLKAQSTHPDKPGGDKDRFQAVVRAYETLKDPGRRAHYDRTGEDGNPEQSPDAAPLSIIGTMMQAIMENPASLHTDFVEEMRRALSLNVRDAESASKNAADEAGRLEKILARLNGKTEKDTVLHNIVRQRIEAKTQASENFLEQRAHFERAREILESYDFDPETEKSEFYPVGVFPPRPQGGFFR